MVLNKFQFKVTKQVYSLDAKLWLRIIFKIAKNNDITNLGNYLGRMSTSGSTGKNNKTSMGIGPIGQARQQGCFGNILEHLDLRDLQGCQIFMKLDWQMTVNRGEITLNAVKLNDIVNCYWTINRHKKC